MTEIRHYTMNKTPHQKFVLPLLFVAMVISCTPTRAEDTSAYWGCVDLVDSLFADSLGGQLDGKPPLVEAWILTESTLIGSDSYNGVIEANGIRKYAFYYQDGLEHRWDFDLGDEGNYNYSFIIGLNGHGRYYDFTAVATGDTTTSSFTTKCTKHK